MRHLFLSAMILAGLISPCWAADDPDLNVIFVGLHEGRSISSVTGRGGPETEFNRKLFQTIFGLLKEGEAKAANLLKNMPQGAASSDRINVFDMLTKEGAKSLTAMRTGKDKIPIDSVALAFFTLDDLIFMRSVQSSGLQRLTAYVFLGFHAFSFEQREITYTANFVLPVALKTRGEDFYSDFLCRLRDCKKEYSGKELKEIKQIRKKVRKYLNGYLGSVSKIVADGRRFSATLDNLLDRNEVEYGHYVVRLNAAVENYRKKDPDADKGKLINFASMLASSQLSKEVMMVPSFVTDDRMAPMKDRDDRERALRDIIIKTGNNLTPLTGVRVQQKVNIAVEKECGVLPGNVYLICDNIFPEIGATFQMELQVAREQKGSKGNFQLDTISSDLIVSLGAEEEKFCTVDGKPHVNLHYDYTDKYVKDAKVVRGEAAFFNATFKLFKKVFSKKSMVSDQGAFGAYDKVGEKLCNG